MVGLIIALLVSLAWAFASLELGPRLGWVDAPDADPDLKVHERPAVPLGGVGIFAGVHLALVAGRLFDPGLFVASAIVLVLGLVDDRVGLSPKIRLGVEVVAGVALAILADLSTEGPVGALIVVVVVVVTINAVNLYDGLDGLVGSTAVVSALGVAWLTTVQFGGDGAFGLILAGALLGFLTLNWNPAKVFLGDNGAYTVALFLCYGIFTVGSAKVVSGTVVINRPPITTTTLIALGLLGVFALDLAVTLLRRRKHGRPLFLGDRSHVYDQLRDRGRSVRSIAFMSAAAQAVLVLAVLIADQVVGGVPGVAMMILVAVAAIVLARDRGFLRVDEPGPDAGQPGA